MRTTVQRDGLPIFHVDWIPTDDISATFVAVRAEPGWNDEVVTHLSGYIKWDGCCDIELQDGHFCGAYHAQNHCLLLQHIFTEAERILKRDGGWEKWQE